MEQSWGHAEDKPRVEIALPVQLARRAKTGQYDNAITYQVHARSCHVGHLGKPHNTLCMRLGPVPILRLGKLRLREAQEFLLKITQLGNA